ncbi:peptidylprolyl isomerase [Paenibacillus sp. GCM10027626]|uniref:peptidylprolyl isomerase n=1 Tax=Paenibacillus sp. GCM10027626 TaxID=3273411 RepID=UPI0036296640
MLRTKRFRKGMLIAIAAMLVIVLAAGCGKKAETESNTGKGSNKPPEAGQTTPGEKDGKVIATYKDGTVTEAEFDKYTKFMSVMDQQAAMYLSIPQMKEQFLREYIGYKILESRSTSLSDDEKKKIDEEANAYYNDKIKPALEQNEAIKKTLADAGIDEAFFKAYFKQMNTIGMAEEKKVTEDAIAKKFEESKDGLNVATVRHILVMSGDQGEVKRTDEEALKRAKEVKKLLEEGGDWTKLAKEYSDDGGSKDKGGLYEKQQTGGWVPEFKEAANTQEIGKIGEPVKTSYGYHIIKVEEREMASLEKDKETVKQMIVSESIGKFMQDELPGLITKIDLPQEEAPKPEEGNKTDGADKGTTNEGSKNDGAKNDPGNKDDAAKDGGAKDDAAKDGADKEDTAKNTK